MSGIESAIAQWALLVKVAFVVVGGVLAFAGRFVHDAFVVGGGFVAGATAGLALATPTVAVLSLDGSGTVALVVAVVLAVLIGLLGAVLAWRWYLLVVYLSGAFVGFMGLTTLLGVDPSTTFSEAVAVGMHVPILLAPLAFGVVLPLMGLAMVGLMVPFLTRHEELTDLVFERGLLEERPKWEGKTGWLRALVGALCGLALTGLSSSLWVFEASRRIMGAWFGQFLTVLTSDLGVSLAVLAGAWVVGAVVWYVHRAVLAIETSLVGAALVSVAGVGDRFLIAVVESEVATALDLLSPSSLVFVVVTVLSVLVQAGLTFGVSESTDSE